MFQENQYTVHRLVQEVLRMQIPEEQRQGWVELSLRLIDSYLPLEQDSLITWSAWDLLRPHAAQVLDYADRCGVLEPTAKLRNHLGLLLKVRGLYTEAEAFSRRALEIAEATFGPEHRVVAVELNHLAGVLMALDRPAEAEPLYRRALQIAELTLEAQDPELAVDLNNLALALKALNRPAEAEKLLRRALGLFEDNLGAEAVRARKTREHLEDLARDRTGSEPIHRAPRREQVQARAYRTFDFSLKIEPQQAGEYPVIVIGSPAGEGRGVLRLPAPLEIGALLDQVMERLADSRTARGSEARHAAEQVGDLLFRALFNGSVLKLFEQSLGNAGEERNQGLRMRLHFDPSHPELAPLTSLPWEFLYRRELREFLSLGRRSPFVRSLDVPRPARPLQLASSVRILVVSAQPTTIEFLAAERECHLIEESLRGVPGVSVMVLHRATPETLRRTLLEQVFHVLHFVGHGTFDPGSGEGSLVFEDATGLPALLPGPLVADLLRDIDTLRLVFLNTCGGARVGRRAGVDPFAGVATSLVMAGLPAVLAMQFDISDMAAIAFSGAFYRRLAAGDPIDVATVEGRMAIRLGDPGSLEWATPVLYLQSTGDLFTFAAPEPSVVMYHPELARHIIDFGPLIKEKTLGFVGRRRVFEAVDQFVQANSRGYFLLRGAPGIGKSAFLAELVRRTQALHHFNVRAAGINRADIFLANMSAQLIVRYGLDYSALPPEATQDGRFFGALLAEVSDKLAPGEKALLMINALDEADSASLAPGANTLYLPVTLPSGVYIIATSRRGPLPLWIDCEQQTFELEEDAEQNIADLREFLELRLAAPGIRSYLRAQGLGEDEFVEEMVGRSEGSFIYLRYVLAEIERGTYHERRIGALPAGLMQFYEDQWRRMRAKDEEAWLGYQLPILVALTVTREPISVDLIAEFSGIPDHRRIRAVLADWGDFLYTVESEVEGRRQKRYRLYHASFHDFVAAKDEVAGEHVDLRPLTGAWLTPSGRSWRESCNGGRPSGEALATRIRRGRSSAIRGGGRDVGRPGSGRVGISCRGTGTPASPSGPSSPT
jgi:tetratricopeptide (TPR) repeat protein